MRFCERPVPLFVNGIEWFGDCGKCLSCRISRRSVWSLRMLHETKSDVACAFVTLTYDPEHLPVTGVCPEGILLKSDLQRFFKRLRKVFGPRSNDQRKIRYYACGEYGELLRPHYHAIIWGISPADRAVVSSVWGAGRVTVDPCNEHTIKYVAGYVTKKLGGTHRQAYPPEFQVFSNRIGVDWLHANFVKVLYDANLQFRKVNFKIPRSYIAILNDMWPDAAQGMADRRFEQSVLASAEKIAEVMPKFGGMEWIDLEDEQRAELMDALFLRGELYNQELKQRQDIKEKGAAVRKLLRG